MSQKLLLFISDCKYIVIFNIIFLKISLLFMFCPWYHLVEPYLTLQISFLDVEDIVYQSVPYKWLDTVEHLKTFTVSKILENFTKSVTIKTGSNGNNNACSWNTAHIFYIQSSSCRLLWWYHLLLSVPC